jgi:Putative methyltransferase
VADSPSQPRWNPADVDWRQWHDEYRDPTSRLSSRLAVVQKAIRDWLDRQPAGELRILSICAGQGHDVVGALGGHARRGDVSGLLVELDPENVADANEALREAGVMRVRAVVGDAGTTSSFASVVPADLVLVCGVFGNITDEDVRRTIKALPTLCADGATVIWTRHRLEPDLTPAIRDWFARAGFDELLFASPGVGKYAVGVHRLARPPEPFSSGVQLFTFFRVAGGRQVPHL